MSQGADLRFFVTMHSTEEQKGEFHFQIPYRPKIEVFVNAKDEISIFADESGVSIPLEYAEQVAKAIVEAAKEGI